MRTSSRIGLGVAAVLFLLVGLYFALKPGDPPPPDALIAETLQDAEHAARRHDIGGIMDAISDDFQAGEWNKTRLRLLLTRTLRQSRGDDYNVTVSRPRILEIPGKPDTREVVSRLSVFESENGENLWGANPAVFVMRREERRHNLFFIEPRWRIVSIANPATLLNPADDAVGN